MMRKGKEGAEGGRSRAYLMERKKAGLAEGRGQRAGGGGKSRGTGGGDRGREEGRRGRWVG